ncbi:MAG: uncharacterized protein QOK40_1387 [Miltoncostaeaceae bacterium]|nr:uncharacterized protein [Miltoncostaeaceae bacterium]
MGRMRVDRLCGPPGLLLHEGPGGSACLAERCYLARSPLARTVGLLATADLAADEALWLEPCASVHSLGLRARIGCAFLAPDGSVLRVVDPLPPGRVASARGARAVVECAAGRLAHVVPGARLRLDFLAPSERLEVPAGG